MYWRFTLSETQANLIKYKKEGTGFQAGIYIMKITVFQGSPNQGGSTAYLCSQFCRGAQDAGHETGIIHLSKLNIHPCTGCLYCGYEGPCAQRDDMDLLRRTILDSDMLVFATPLYYYGMSAQLKTVIDRFCSSNFSIQEKHFRSVLITAAWNADDWTFEALTAHYRTLVRYLNLTDEGMILGYGCGTLQQTKRSSSAENAYLLGKGLK